MEKEKQDMKLHDGLPPLLSVDNIANGALHELLQRELSRVAENINDPNTSNTQKRKIQVNFEFIPYPDRTGSTIELSVKSTLAGVKQQVAQKGGVVLVNEVSVTPRRTLAPYRTFREVNQPASDFIFRVRNSPQRGNECALFEADGGAWKIAAVQNIKEWLSNRLKGSTGAGLGDIPIIS